MQGITPPDSRTWPHLKWHFVPVGFVNEHKLTRPCWHLPSAALTALLFEAAALACSRSGAGPQVACACSAAVSIGCSRAPASRASLVGTLLRWPACLSNPLALTAAAGTSSYSFTRMDGLCPGPTNAAGATEHPDVHLVHPCHSPFPLLRHHHHHCHHRRPHPHPHRIASHRITSLRSTHARAQPYQGINSLLTFTRTHTHTA